MKINSKVELDALLNAVKQAKHDIYLRSAQGDQYNLKSELSKYVAIGALLSDKSNELELFCSDINDEPIFYKLFQEYPEIL